MTHFTDAGDISPEECEREYDRDELRLLDGKQLCYDCFCEEAWLSADEPEEEQ